ncbi:hypothetical protein WJX84_000671 [Apatococcus fuscideae]|uniref:BZIP domain-containing protein n=1 Tax=Apatococcus fuscideae TaxID=2026836 RepID=A0AAW1TAP8_9CHLO
MDTSTPTEGGRMEMLEGARSPWPSATGYQEEAQPTSSGSQPSRDGSRSTNQLESHPHGSIDTDMQKVLDRAKNMSEKNRKAQKRYRDRQRDKVDGYKRQVDELTAQVQRLLAERASRPPPAAPPNSRNPTRGLEAGSLSASSCSAADADPNLSDASAVVRCILDLVQSLAAVIPDGRQHLSGLHKDPAVSWERASQALINVWQAHVNEVTRLLIRGAADAGSAYHAQLTALCHAVQGVRMMSLRKYPLLVRWLQLRLKQADAAVNYARAVESVNLTAQQVSGVLQARQAFKAGLAVLSEQRRQSFQPLAAALADHCSSEASLAEWHLRQHQACQRSQALFAEENAIFVAFVNAMFQALGPITIARLYAEASFCDYLSFAIAVEAAVSGTQDPGLAQAAQPQQHTSPQQQQLPLQLPQQPPMELLPTPFSLIDYYSDIGNLSPARSSQLFGALDFLQDPSLSPGLGV